MELFRRRLAIAKPGKLLSRQVCRKAHMPGKNDCNAVPASSPGLAISGDSAIPLGKVEENGREEVL
jgi:hypothetical protein